MPLKRKRKREYAKNLKIERGVFDKRTMLTLYKMLNKGILDQIIGIIKEGKESVILLGKKKEQSLAIKVYRTEASDFKKMWKYIIGDPRFSRVKKSKVPGSESTIDAWCQREYKNLDIAYKAEVSCPKPIAFSNNILVMEFIGDKEPAPRLIDTVLKNPQQAYKYILSDLEKIVKAGLIHGDLSAFNILIKDNTYIIDFSHGTLITSPIAPELLKRDIKNINFYFSRLKVRVEDDEKLYSRLTAGEKHDRFY